MGLTAQTMNPPMLRACLIHPSPSLLSEFAASWTLGQAGEQKCQLGQDESPSERDKVPISESKATRKSPGSASKLPCVQDEVTISSPSGLHWQLGLRLDDAMVGSDLLQKGEWEGEKLGAASAEEPWRASSPQEGLWRGPQTAPNCFSSLSLSFLICKMG